MFEGLRVASCVIVPEVLQEASLKESAISHVTIRTYAVYHIDIQTSNKYTCSMNKNNKQTTMRFTEQDLEAIARIRDLYGCISDTAAVRLALQLVARQETPALSTRRKEDLFPPHG